ncbi:GGDEF domain-containing protein [Metabacillus bambusae]|uniref:GGDEF domain-containing protein n=1 Tax=Metabacillus bambusae TaxID=2795218 RepID=A0ABS3NA05_9BACI|nr:sensor domain-containing diguanylate cyclase [Metabacillus bambusae]MBO1514748.1 GGDEF domain-containing protein [Metabacillus bambusae]
MDKKVHVALWICWIIATPIFLTVAFDISPPAFKGYEWDIAAFLLLMCLVSIWPIIINDTSIFYVQGVSLVVFLFFGLFIEMILTQIAVIVLLLKVRVGFKDLYRYPLNALLFYCISLGGAGVYYLVGGTHGLLTFNEDFLAIIAYGLSVFIINQSLLSFFQVFIFKMKFKFLTRGFLWELFTSLLVFPMGIGLYFLYLQAGMKAIFFVGIPLLGLSIFLALYYKTQRINHYLQQASEIGHQLTERLQKKDVLDIFMEKVTNMIPLEAAYIIDVYEKDKLRIVRKFENGKIHVNVEEAKSPDRGISGHVYIMRESVIFHRRKQWKHIHKSQLPETVESVIGVPVIRNQDLVGIVILASNKKHAFDRAQLMIIDLLSAYLGVAVENAKNYEETRRQSEHCPLTGLYNYRYLEHKLDREFKHLQQRKLDTLTLILLDIDHFKAVNDTYGHHAGNEVLIQLSKRLLQYVRKKGTVARYGGEEFVILLPNFEKQNSVAFAEELRQLIANQPFEIEHSLQNNNSRTISVFITASFGVATAPIDADDTFSLIRHADRAMYIGAKKAGRNKVAAYVS